MSFIDTGARMKQAANFQGQRFGKLLVLGYVRDGTRHSKWECRCDCGNTCRPAATALRQGRQVSCGCHRNAGNKARATTHGQANTAEYRIWKAVKTRCLNRNAPGWANYGGRGITICDRWVKSFEAFRADIGSRPSPKHSLDRIDNNKGYEPGNCRWVTRDVQASNTRQNLRVTVDGETLSLKQWCDRLSMPYAAVRTRIRELNWTAYRALTVPVRHCRRIADLPDSLLRSTRRIWHGMRQRCYDARCRIYRWYGAKGVTICVRWRESFANFLDDMGTRPSGGHSIDRVDPDKGYWCGQQTCAECVGRGPNCKWATRAEQAAHKSGNKVTPRVVAPRKLVVVAESPTAPKPIVHNLPEYDVWIRVKKLETTWPEWRKSFEAFIRDVGMRPSRRYFFAMIDPAQGHRPGNCWWAPHSIRRVGTHIYAGG